MSQDEIDYEINEQLVFITGESATGKSASLMNIPNQENWFYLNCESGKRLPFRNKFQTFKITDPYLIYDAFNEARGRDDVHGIVIDTVTFMMDMFESLYIIGNSNTQKAWGDYAQFFKNLMQQYVAPFGKPVIMLGHTKSEYNEKTLDYNVSVPVKGSLKNNGLEAYFSTVVSTKKVELKKLKDYKSDLLHITEQDEMLGYKHVFQTQLTKDTVGERIRSPMGMFSVQETFMDNDAALLLHHLAQYYGN